MRLCMVHNIYVFYISTFRLAILLLFVDTKGMLWYNNIVDAGQCILV